MLDIAQNERRRHARPRVKQPFDLKVHAEYQAPRACVGQHPQRVSGAAADLERPITGRQRRLDLPDDPSNDRVACHEPEVAILRRTKIWDVPRVESLVVRGRSRLHGNHAQHWSTMNLYVGLMSRGAILRTVSPTQSIATAQEDSMRQILASIACMLALTPATALAVNNTLATALPAAPGEARSQTV